MIHATPKTGPGIAAIASFGLVFATTVAAQSSEHGRKYKAPPPTAHIVVTVEKGYNGKPLPNAAVVFHAVREGRDDGNLEVKTDPEGKAAIDVLEVGSHVTVQVIATGFATYATDFDITNDGKDLLVKLQSPRAQVSTYADTAGEAAQVRPGIQEPNHLVRPAGPVSPNSAVLSGSVSDLGGARVPGAVITIRDVTGKLDPVRVIARADGSFRRGDLPAGTYDIQVSAIGFQSQTHSRVVLGAGDQRVFDDRLPADRPQAQSSGSPQ